MIQIRWNSVEGHFCPTQPQKRLPQGAPRSFRPSVKTGLAPADASARFLGGADDRLGHGSFEPSVATNIAGAAERFRGSSLFSRAQAPCCCGPHAEWNTRGPPRTVAFSHSPSSGLVFNCSTMWPPIDSWFQGVRWSSGPWTTTFSLWNGFGGVWRHILQDCCCTVKSQQNYHKFQNIRRYSIWMSCWKDFAQMC